MCAERLLEAITKVIEAKDKDRDDANRAAGLVRTITKLKDCDESSIAWEQPCWGADPVTRVIRYLKHADQKPSQMLETDKQEKQTRCLKYLNSLLYGQDKDATMPEMANCMVAIREAPEQMLLENLEHPVFMKDAAECVKILCMLGGTFGGGLHGPLGGGFRTIASKLGMVERCVVALLR